MGKLFLGPTHSTFNISWLKCSLIVFTLRKGLFMFVAWVAYVKDFMFINNINGCQPQAIGVILAWE